MSSMATRSLSLTQPPDRDSFSLQRKKCERCGRRVTVHVGAGETLKCICGAAIRGTGPVDWEEGRRQAEQDAKNATPAKMKKAPPSNARAFDEPSGSKRFTRRYSSPNKYPPLPTGNISASELTEVDSDEDGLTSSAPTALESVEALASSRTLFKLGAADLPVFKYSKQQTPLQNINASILDPPQNPKPELLILKGKKRTMDVKCKRHGIRTWSARTITCTSSEMKIERFKAADQYELEYEVKYSEILRVIPRDGSGSENVLDIECVPEPSSGSAALGNASPTPEGSSSGAIETPTYQDSAKILVWSLAAPDASTAKGWVKHLQTACLYNAVVKGLGIVRVTSFVLQGADVNVCDPLSGEPVVALCVRSGQIEEARALVANGAHTGSLLNELYVRAVGFQPIVSFITSNGLDINMRGYDKLEATLLHHAVFQGDLMSVKQLLALSANPNLLDGERNRPIHAALKLRRPDIAVELIRAGCGVNVPDENGEFPLHLALKLGMHTVVELLEQSGANLCQVDPRGWSPLGIAIDLFLKESAALLIERGADVAQICPGNNEPLHLALLKGARMLDLSNLLIRRGANLHTVNGKGFTAFHLSIQIEAYDLVREMAMLDQGKGLNVQNADGNAPLHLVSASRIVSMIHTFLDCGADANLQNNEGETPMYAYISALAEPASESMERLNVTQNYQDLIPDVEIVLEVLRHFIRRGFTGLQRTRRGGRTVLHAAMDRGHYPSARYLINRFPDLLDKQDAKRYTPLHFAAKRWWPVWKLGPLRMLCALGADVNVLNDADENALHLAVMSRRVEAVELLLSYRAETFHWNKAGMTPLHIAVEQGMEDVVGIMIKWNADINMRSASGETPLMIALRHRHKDIAKELIAAGADPSIQMPKTRVTALSIVMRDPQPDMAAALCRSDFAPWTMIDATGAPPRRRCRQYAEEMKTITSQGDLATQEAVNQMSRNYAEIETMLKDYEKAASERLLSLQSRRAAINDACELLYDLTVNELQIESQPHRVLGRKTGKMKRATLHAPITTQRLEGSGEEARSNAGRPELLPLKSMASMPESTTGLRRSNSMGELGSANNVANAGSSEEVSTVPVIPEYDELGSIEQLGNGRMRRDSVEMWRNLTPQEKAAKRSEVLRKVADDKRRLETMVQSLQTTRDQLRDRCNTGEGVTKSLDDAFFAAYYDIKRALHLSGKLGERFLGRDELEKAVQTLVRILFAIMALQDEVWGVAGAAITATGEVKKPVLTRRILETVAKVAPDVYPAKWPAWPTWNHYEDEN